MMVLTEFIRLLENARKRYCLVGDEKAGVVACLDHEGRLFAVLDGMILNRVNASAIEGVSTREQYRNPGGDVLWPAPEGTRFGYEYPTGKWRVPPGLTGARYQVVAQTSSSAAIEAEVDLINSQGLGIPCVFKRDIAIERHGSTLTLKTVESITYIGARSLKRAECLIAPWSLSQFDSAEGAEAIFAHINGSLRDLYDPSEGQRYVENGRCHSKTDSSQRYQIALGEEVESLEFRNPSSALKVRRMAKVLTTGGDYIDIADSPMESAPSAKGVRFSIYSDMGGFMEIEAAGACPEQMETGIASALEVTTCFEIDGD